MWARTRCAMAVGITALVLSEVVLAFTVPIHGSISRRALGAISVTLSSGQVVGFSQRAITEIVDANGAVDDGLSQALFRPSRHFTNEDFSGASQRLVTLRGQINTALTANPPKGAQARVLLGQALHTVQDFYAHSNWVELGNATINVNLGRITFPDPPFFTFAPCLFNVNNLTGGTGGGLTSGYVVEPTVCEAFPGKCAHGNYTVLCPGINKDRNTSIPIIGAPVSPFHPAAAALAQAATVDYVLNQVLADVAGDDRAIRALLDVRGSVAFVIDDTGSMGPEINGVKSIVNQLVALVDADPDRRPSNWVLVRFGDPDIGNAFVTDDAAALLAAVNALFASGGGDCPELSQGAMLEAINNADPASQLYLFTDASAKDGGLRNVVIATAQARQTQLNFPLTGTCSPIDEAYLREAEETGGQVFLVNQSETDLFFNLIEPRLSPSLVRVLARRQELSGAPITLPIPVDTTISRLLVAVSVGPTGTVLLRRPDGSAVLPSDAGVTITELTGGSVISIDSPVPGAWELDLDGSGEVTAVVDAVSSIELRDFAFVDPNEDIHGGFFPIPGQPVVAQTAFGQVTLLGPFADAAFELVDQTGNLLAEPSLLQGFTLEDVDLFVEADETRFTGSIDVPAGSFRLEAIGTDTNGFSFRRQMPTLFRARTVGVDVDPDAIDVAPIGVPVSITFFVTNAGDAGSFSLEGGDTGGFVTGVTPTAVSLESGATAPVSVDLFVPPGVEEGTLFSVTLTATRASDPDDFNSATANLGVQGDLPPELDCAVMPIDGGGDDDDDDDGRLLIEINATDDSGMVTVVAEIDIGCAVIPVSSGQIVELECEDDDDSSSEDDSSDSSSDDSSPDVDCEFEFDDGVLEIESDMAVLIVTATDPAGNVTVCELDLCAVPDDDDDDDESSDDSSSGDSSDDEI